jgi:hypothetical protein
MGRYSKRIRRRALRSRVPASPENSKAKNGEVVRGEIIQTWEAGTLPAELHPQEIQRILTFIA